MKSPFDDMHGEQYLEHVEIAKGLCAKFCALTAIYPDRTVATALCGALRMITYRQPEPEAAMEQLIEALKDGGDEKK